MPAELRGEMGNYSPVPLGVKPRWLAEELGYDPRSRRREVVGALVRYVAAGIPPRPEWWDEYRELVARH